MSSDTPPAVPSLAVTTETQQWMIKCAMISFSLALGVSLVMLFAIAVLRDGSSTQALTDTLVKVILAVIGGMGLTGFSHAWSVTATTHASVARAQIAANNRLPQAALATLGGPDGSAVAAPVVAAPVVQAPVVVLPPTPPPDARHPDAPATTGAATQAEV